MVTYVFMEEGNKIFIYNPCFMLNCFALSNYIVLACCYDNYCLVGYAVVSKTCCST